MAETTQKNFRMSEDAIRLLHSVARARGMTETDVVEICVAKYALDIGQDVDRAKELLFQEICGVIARVPLDVANVYIPKNSLIPLDRLAEKFNTTRGKLVEALIQEAQTKDWVENSPAAKRLFRLSQPRAEDLARFAANEETARAGAATEAVKQSLGQSAAGSLTEMAGTQWTEGKKEKGKKKT